MYRVPTEQVGFIIGKGGKMISKIVKETNSLLSIPVNEFLLYYVRNYFNILSF